MYFYKLKAHTEQIDDAAYCRLEDDYGVQQYELHQGEEFKRTDLHFTFLYDEQDGAELTDCLENDIGWFVVSEKLKQLIQESNTTVQFIPVTVKNMTTHTTIEGYSICNVLTVLDALCLEESDYSIYKTSKGDFLNVKKYAIHQDKVGDVDLFKLGNGEEIPLFFSERFVNELDARGITAMDFLKVRAV